MMVKAMATIFLCLSNRMAEHVFSFLKITTFFPAFSEGFNLQSKNNSKLYPYFAYVSLTKPIFYLTI